MKRLFAIGDVHGCCKTFRELIFNRIRLEKDDRLILLGDYIDRGKMIREVVDLIIDLINDGYDIKPLTGNHEWMMLNAYDNSGMLPLWLMNDGMTTIKSMGLTDIRGIEEKYISFFRGLGYYHREGEFLFVHAGFNDEAEDPFSDTDSMIWESRFEYSHPVFENLRIIHGHRPKQIDYVRDLISRNNKIIPIDTGCVYVNDYGWLTALELPDMKLYAVENID